MADTVRIKAIVDQIKAELARVLKSNGFNTDLGSNIKTESVSMAALAGPVCTVAVTGKQRIPGGGVSVEGMIAILLPSNYTDALNTVYDGADDVERLLDEMGDRMVSGVVQGSGAFVPQFHSAVFLDRPDGMPVVAAEITWTSGYRR